MNFINYYTPLQKITSTLDRIIGFDPNKDRGFNKTLYYQINTIGVYRGVANNLKNE